MKASCKKFFPLIFEVAVFLLAFFFASCSEDKPNIIMTQVNIIFDFDATERPLQRMSVFVDMASNVRRIESLSASCGEYSWNIESPVLFQGDKHFWAGYMRLEPPPNLQKFPKGRYSFSCIDAAGEKADGSFFIDYDERLLASVFSEELFPKEKWKRLIAIYSQAGELLYFESPKEEWKNSEIIFSTIADSNSYRMVFESDATLCLGPKIFKPQEKKPEDANNKNDENHNSNSDEKKTSGEGDKSASEMPSNANDGDAAKKNEGDAKKDERQ